MKDGTKPLSLAWTLSKNPRGESIKVYYDSMLVVGQVRGEFEAKDQRMQLSLGQVKQLPTNFGTFTIS